MSSSKKPLGLYIHVPFCLNKCIYCNFYSVVSLSLIERYVDCVCKQVDFQSQLFSFDNYFVDSIYFGGGTPSLLSCNNLYKILNSVYANFDVSSTAELSIECNPSSLNLQFLKDLQFLNFNRLSIGVQSAIDSELKFLGRLHSFKQAQQAFSDALSVGFRNLSADLIIGLPNQSVKDILCNIERFGALPLKHISIYILKIEPETPLAKLNLKGVLSEDVLAQFFVSCASSFEQRGLFQYEISNFAEPGFECVHNLKYWTLKDYFGFGPSAHSFFQGNRFFTLPDLDLFLKNPINYRSDDCFLSANLEWLMLSTRLKKPILFKDLEAHGFGLDKFLLKLKRLAYSKLVVLNDVGFSLTTKGLLVQNSVYLFLTS